MAPTKKKGVFSLRMSRGILFSTLIILLALFLIEAGTAARAGSVELAPVHPSRLDLLSCTYTVPEQGVFRFEFFRNEDVDQLLFSRETDKRTVAYQPQGLANGDRVRCVVGKRDFQGEYNGVGFDTVTLGAFQCNDLADNDGDGQTDMQDPGCETRSGREERTDYAAFCRTHKNNVFCRGWGMENIILFCNAKPSEALCRQFREGYLARAEQWCRQMPQNAFCTGTEDIAGRCVLPAVPAAPQEDLLCSEFSTGMLVPCRDEGKCFEISDAMAEAFCRLHPRPPCPEQPRADADADADNAADAANGADEEAEREQDAAQPALDADGEAAEQAEQRREEIREAVEEMYRNIRERQRRLEARQEREEEEKTAGKAASSGEELLVEQPLELVEEETEKMEKIIFKKEKPMEKKGSVPITGFVAASGGVIALLAVVFYLLLRAKPKQPVPLPAVKSIRIRKKREKGTKEKNAKEKGAMRR